MMPAAQRWSRRHPGVLDQRNNCDPCSSKLAARQQAHRSLRVNGTKFKVAAPLRCWGAETKGTGVNADPDFIPVPFNSPAQFVS
jgi:hypothetical protein